MFELLKKKVIWRFFLIAIIFAIFINFIFKLVYPEVPGDKLLFAVWWIAFAIALIVETTIYFYRKA